MASVGNAELLAAFKGTLPTCHASAAAEWLALHSLACLGSHAAVEGFGRKHHQRSSSSHAASQAISAAAPLARLAVPTAGSYKQKPHISVPTDTAHCVATGVKSYLQINRGFAVSCSAFHSEAALDNASDDESKHVMGYSNSNGNSSHTHAGMKQNQQHSQLHYHNHQQQNHSQQHGQTHKHSQHHRHTHTTGQLHVAHGRRHATSSSSTPDPLSQQLLGCKGMGVLRRIMLKYKANMGPEQIANTLLTLQHLVLQARLQRAGQQQLAPHPADEGYQGEQLQRPLAGRGQPRVQAAQNLGPATTRVLERDGPMEQLTSQMLGELGNMIWHHMGDMSGPELAKLLYSWAKLDWHAESQLLADVTASFHAAAAAGREGQQPHAVQDQEPNEAWLAAGLWGLSKIEQPLSVPSLQLLVHHWQRLVPLWSQQQLVDVAWAITATADEQTAMAATDPGSVAAAEQAVIVTELRPVVLGLAESLVELLQLLPSGSGTSAAFAVWPETLLQAEVPSAASAHQPPQQRLGLGTRSKAPQLAWRMLQALAAVGVNVSEPSGRVADVAAALSRAMQPKGMAW